jgi:hypothetical protein
MDDIVLNILKKIGINSNSIQTLDGQIVVRELFLSNSKYEELQDEVNCLKQFLSSSSLTSLQNPAGLIQKWPLLNLSRQLLKTYNYTMEPIRKSDGYDDDGKKKYRRFFMIKRRQEIIEI